MPGLGCIRQGPAHRESTRVTWGSPVGGWCGPPWMMMKMGRTSRPHTPPYTTWFSEMGVDRVNQPPSEWRPLGEAWLGGCLPKWTSARRNPRPWKGSTLTGGHGNGWKVLRMRKSHGMSCSPC